MAVDVLLKMRRLSPIDCGQTTFAPGFSGSIFIINPPTSSHPSAKTGVAIA
jgi:hypothetical protein